MKQETMKPGIELPNTELTEQIIAAAIRVHRELGPGFLEAIYEQALAIEFAEQGIAFESQKPVAVLYREHHVGEHRLDFLVAGEVVLELKAISALEDVHFAIVRSYLRATHLEIGLLLNFATPTLTIKRIGSTFKGGHTASFGIHV
ncbi:MAG: GxxExxY protein [Alphaproteobacteria bacterium]|nr:GxxExxY protein [Alphaproteobacteria bacterium]